MKPVSSIKPPCPYRSWLGALLAAASLAPAWAAAPAAIALPDSAAGTLAGALIQHVNSGNTAQLQAWLPTILSGSIAREDQAAFGKELGSAVADGGGLDLVDVRTDPRQPGLLQVAVKARQLDRRALLVLAADTHNPGKLAQAAIFPMDDPGLYAGWPKRAVAPAKLRELVDKALDQWALSADFSGCVTIVDGQHTLLNECRGLAERNFGVPVDQRTRFHIGSMDKMFTAVAIGQLVEAGKLSWDATLAQLVPEYPDQQTARGITVWQLLHHTAGLGDFLVPEYFQRREAFIDPVDYLDLIARQPKLDPPGKAWSYSNAGYILLGRIVENVSGESYFDYIQRHVFGPLGMHDSGFDRLDEVTPRLAVGYFHESLFSRDWKAAWLKLGVIGGPAGGGYSTNTDLLKFAAGLRDNQLVNAATLNKMFADEVPAGPGAYAAGFGDRLSHGRSIRGHAGGIEGSTANLQLVWGTPMTVALTSNQGPSEHWMLVEYIADLLAASDPGTLKSPH